MFYFNIAILTVSDEHILNILVDKLYYDLTKLLQLKESFRLLTIRKRSISEPSEAGMVLDTWKNENIIFYVGANSGEFRNNFSQEEELKIKSESPTLGSLLFTNQSNSTESCFLNGSALVHQILSFTLYEDLIKNKLSVFLDAIFEAKHLGLHNDYHVVDSSCCFLYKSEVTLSNPADRPRSSPFSMVSVKDAVKCVLEETLPLGKEYRKLKNCFSYVLADDVKAPEPYPPFDASIKDGYAVIASDPAFNGSLPVILSVVGNTETGHVPEFKVVPGTCARVSTGGVIPESADAVIQVEDTKIHRRHEGDEVSIAFSKKPKQLQDIRVMGTDVPEGSIVIPARQKIASAEIGVLSIFGISNVKVFKKPWIAVMSTGDEVIEPENPVYPGCIRDSNKTTLSHMLIEHHIPFVDVGIAKDNPDIVKSHLMLALSAADIVISTGGVSMGEKDIMKEVLKKDFGATIHFGRVHMKPGKPTTFSTVNFNGEKKFIFSLPGNPVSACVCFYLFVMPCIRKMMGYTDPEHKPIKVKLKNDLKLDERPEFCRVSLNCGTDGVFVAETTGDQQSSRLLSMQNADALLVLPPRTKGLQILKAETLVDALMLKSL